MNPEPANNMKGDQLPARTTGRVLALATISLLATGLSIAEPTVGPSAVDRVIPAKFRRVTAFNPIMTDRSHPAILPNRVSLAQVLAQNRPIEALGPTNNGGVDEEPRVKPGGFLPFSERPINYLQTIPGDPVSQLQQRLLSGEADLVFEPAQGGYLRSVLRHLQIPVESQVLVFSKTSLQSNNISRRTPRAIYFSDDVYVGWVQGGSIEIASFDPVQGAIYYTQPNRQTEKPQFQAADVQCMQCHVSAATRGIPGVLVRSVHNSNGVAPAESQNGVIRIGHEVPFEERWGGWYVTGETASLRHNGQQLSADSVDLSAYLSVHSDAVALLVLDHQTQMHNLITLTNYQTRFALHRDSQRGDIVLAESPSEDARRQYESAAELLIRYFLFLNEVPLEGPVSGTSGFAEAFMKTAVRDPQGRSLRDLNLRTRTFEYPCSFLIYSGAFDSLPTPVKDYIYHRLYEILSGQDRSPDFARLGAPQRRAVLEILRATKPGLPSEWHAPADDAL